MSRKGMAQAMRMREDAAQRRRVEPTPTGGEEQRSLRAADELRSCCMEIAGEGVRGLFAKRDDALLPALPAHVELLPVEVDVAEIESHCLRAAKPGRVDQLDERLVPHRQRPVPLERRERGLHFGWLRRIGQ